MKLQIPKIFAKAPSTARSSTLVEAVARQQGIRHQRGRLHAQLYTTGRPVTIISKIGKEAGVPIDLRIGHRKRNQPDIVKEGDGRVAGGRGALASTGRGEMDLVADGQVGAPGSRRTSSRRSANPHLALTFQPPKGIAVSTRASRTSSCARRRRSSRTRTGSSRAAPPDAERLAGEATGRKESGDDFRASSEGREEICKAAAGGAGEGRPRPRSTATRLERLHKALGQGS